MSILETEELVMWRDSVAGFLDKEAPAEEIEKWDAAKIVPRE